jgi:hypothetical protein
MLQSQALILELRYPKYNVLGVWGAGEARHWNYLAEETINLTSQFVRCSHMLSLYVAMTAL